MASVINGSIVSKSESIDVVLNVIVEQYDYYLIGRTNNSRTIFNGKRKITFGAAGRPCSSTGYFFIVDEDAFLPSYETFPQTHNDGLIRFCEKLCNMLKEGNETK